MLSGISRISLRTSPDSLTRFSSFTSFAANAGNSNAHARNIADRVFMSPPFGEHFILTSNVGEKQTPIRCRPAVLNLSRLQPGLSGNDQLGAPFVTWRYP